MYQFVSAKLGLDLPGKRLWIGSGSALGRNGFSTRQLPPLEKPDPPV